MMQALHIFRKDVRHLWKELTLYAGLLVCSAVAVPQTWAGNESANPMLGIFVTLTMTLIGITWVVLIARLVHDEALVGDRQFWITRPYAWGALLGAKLLFVAVCVAAPFGAMQCVMVHCAGLSVWAALPGLLLTLARFVVATWLPLVAIAAITDTLIAMFLVAAGSLAAWAATLTIFGNVDGTHTQPAFVFETIGPVFAVLLVGILMYQYAVRRTTRTRIALVAVIVLFLGLFFATNGVMFRGAVRSVISSQYAMAANTPLRLRFDPSAVRYQKDSDDSDSASFWKVNLPVVLEGMDPAFRLKDASVAFTLDAAGTHYVSPWRPAVVAETGLVIQVPRKVMERVRGADVRLQLSLAAERVTPGPAYVATEADRFVVPDNGMCVLVNATQGKNLVCRYAFQSPPPTVVTAQSCDASAGTRPSSAVIRSIYGLGAKLDPVVEEPVDLGGALCAGSQVTFVAYRPGGKFRVELDVPEIALGRYVVR